VPTADNAADDATRSQRGVDVIQDLRWLRGPAFLRQPAASWPGPEEGTERVPDAPDEEEMPSEFALVVANDFVIQFQRFSSFNRLVRIMAGSYGLRAYAANREAISRNIALLQHNVRT